MEQQQRSLIFTAAVGLIILAIIIGSIYYLVKFIQGRVATSRQNVQTSENIAQTPEGSPAETTLSPDGTTQIPAPQVGDNSGAQTAPSNVAGKKVYNAGEFQLVYPNTWGVTSCDNSPNIEFDPASGADAKISCDVASKPVTVIVGNVSGCEGESVKMGQVDVVKTQQNDGNYVKTQWCTKTSPVFNITQRVSPDGERATSKQDYSKQIEEMISNLSFSRGS